MSGNEASAIGSLRAISGESTFSSSCASGGYAQSLADLYKAPGTSNSGFISPDLAADPTASPRAATSSQPQRRAPSTTAVVATGVTSCIHTAPVAALIPTYFGSKCGPGRIPTARPARAPSASDRAAARSSSAAPRRLPSRFTAGGDAADSESSSTSAPPSGRERSGFAPWRLPVRQPKRHPQRVPLTAKHLQYATALKL